MDASHRPSSYVLGLDFGGTKLACGLWRVGDAGLCATRRQPTDAAGGATGSLAQMLAMARALLAEGGVAAGQLAGVGVSFGGHVDAARGVILRSVHVGGWEGFPLRDHVRAEFGVPAQVENDANAAALAEARFGAGRGHSSLLYVTISTGIGGGLVVDGQIYRGAHGMAREIGHTVVAPDGLLCPCGRRGCLEAVAAGPAIARAAQARLDADPSLASRLRGQATLRAEDVAQAARDGDTLALATLDTAFTYLGLGLANAVNLLDPGLVVLGGGVTRIGAPLFDRVCAVVAERALVPCDIVPALLGDDVGVWGGVAVIERRAGGIPVDVSVSR